MADVEAVVQEAVGGQAATQVIQGEKLFDWMMGLGGYTIGVFEPAFGWRALAIAGSSDNLSPQQGYDVRVGLDGQRMSLSVDDVRVLELVYGNEPSGLERPCRPRRGRLCLSQGRHRLDLFH